MSGNRSSVILALIAVATLDGIHSLMVGFWNTAVAGRYEIGYSHIRGIGFRGLRIRYIRRLR